MVSTGRPARPSSAAKSRGFGKRRIERSKYSYSSPPEPMVAIQPIIGTTCVMNPRATFDSGVSPLGNESSRMQTRLVSFLRRTRRISPKAFPRFGTLRMPKDILILSTEPSAAPALGAATVPAASMPCTEERSCASPLTRRTTPVRPVLSTFATPLRSISLLGSTPITASLAAPSFLSCCPTRIPTSAVPVAKSSTLSSGCS
mmetsp:Transcript_53695/g.120220  ORF Transcript_53695/g.120220 Transcript_53695/m.120220 type:complete len:202 (-) Transcript_53695:356-961(-)